jgi:large subunit ribosomal protein L3
MEVGILGKKVGMTSVFDEAGKSVPVSVIEAGPCKITQIKTNGTDRYCAVQLGYESVREDRAKKPRLGHLKKAGVSPLRWLKEFRIQDDEKVSQYQLGQEIRVDIFKPGDYVDITGNSKGRGFQGVVKRHGFTGLRATHGANEYFRRPGSIGTNTFGSNVKKGKKFPGHYGNERITILNLKVIKVDPQENLLVIEGAIPGAKGGLLTIRKTNRG